MGNDFGKILRNSPSPIKRGEFEVESVENYNVIKNLERVEFTEKSKNFSPLREDQSMKREDLSMSRHDQTFLSEPAFIQAKESGQTIPSNLRTDSTNT